MDDIKLRELACIVCDQVMDNTPSQADCVGYAVAGIKRGMQIERDSYQNSDKILDKIERQLRRDRFIAAALTGIVTNQILSTTEEQAADWSIKVADAVLALLDAESFERESEDKL